MADKNDGLAPYLTPISADAPAGEDLTYDEAFLRIREEVDRMGTVSVHVDHERALSGEGGAESAGVDFASLADEARGLLLERARDLQLAAYLTVALAQSKGAEGLAEGLEVTRALAETFGEAVLPTKPLRRRNALQFLADRARDWAAAHTASAADVEALERAREAASGIQAWATETMGEGAPALSGLRQALEEAQARAARQAKGAEPASTNGAGAPAPAAASAAVTSPAEIRSVGDARQAVLRACAFLREHDPQSPQPFRLARALAWAGLTATPPNEAGKTIIDAPDAATRTRFDGLRAGGDPSATLRAVEEVLPGRPLWLDLQRFAVQAAEEAGAPLGPVRAALVSDVTDLVRRVPGVAALTFSDGTPFADQATQAWLGSLAPADAAQATLPADDPLAEIVEGARALAAQGDLDGAVRALQEAGVANRAGRDRLRRRLHVAALCLKSGRHAVATALADALGEEADRRSLEDWEPELALEVWRTAMSAWNAAASAAPAAEKAAALAKAGAAFERVCRLDAAAALGLGGAGDKKGGRG